jgi:hypothetical protein
MNIDLHDPQDTLIEKIMAHFGWYKVKKVELPIENLDISYTFITKDNEPAVKRPAAKKVNTRTPKNGN